jgi:hypothetical protein
MPTKYLNESTVHLQRMTGADRNGWWYYNWCWTIRRFFK